MEIEKYPEIRPGRLCYIECFFLHYLIGGCIINFVVRIQFSIYQNANTREKIGGTIMIGYVEYYLWYLTQPYPMNHTSASYPL